MARPGAVGRESLGQRLPRMLAERTDIDATSGTEYTMWVESAEFLGKMDHFAGDKDETAKVAKRDVDSPDEPSFSTDRSRLDTRRTGASVA